MVKLSVNQREETSVLVRGWHTIRDNSYDSLIPVSESTLFDCKQFIFSVIIDLWFKYFNHW